MRQATTCRITAETNISLTLNLDGKGESNIDTGSGFLDHMLTLFAKHGSFDLDVNCKGDAEVDYHHTAEDIGIVLGQTLAKALGDKKGIFRYGSMMLPMDETLILSAIDLSGRSGLYYVCDIPAQKVGNFDTELSEEFWTAFVRSAACTLHIRKIAGTNSHHIIEGTFKSVARALKAAVAIDTANADSIPSTKGAL